MQKWEYLIVEFRLGSDNTLHPWIVDGQMLPDLEHSPVIYEYIHQLGDKGWELAGTPTPVQLMFKRPKQ